MQHKRVALVTGANQGVGLQVAKELVAAGVTVLVGSRNFERGEAAAKEIGPGAIALQLDVTDRVSIATAAERIRKEFGRLDLLVNNAAISNTRKGSLSLQEYSEDNPPEQRIPRRNTGGVGNQRVRRARRVPGDAATTTRVVGRPHRQRVERSRLADVERRPGPPLPRVLQPGVSGIQGGSQRDNAGHDDRAGVDRDQGQPSLPGFTKTNLNGYAGTESVEEGSREVVRVALLGPDGPTGTFTRWENVTIPW